MLNNKGMTLVEIVIALCILGIVGITFASGFASTAKVLNMATLYKNESAAASNAVELQDKNSGTVFSDKDDSIVFSNGQKKITVSGQLITNDTSNSQTELRYKEFISGSFEEFTID